ncbi:MAG TPA: DUF4956 domain-containing protein [Chthoniobacteraceae bacterium]|jgi:uncharacterized membrane protein YhiD involved in acid resistance
MFTDLQEIFRTSIGYDLPTPPLQEIILALALSFTLQCLISAVYKRTYRGADYSQDYVHTLIILGTVVTVVIQAVRGDAATAFGMFAAFSIIRFRRTVRQSRDIGFIFLAMATGLGVGARQYALAAITTIVICAVIYVFSNGNWFASIRRPHFLRIRVTNDVDYDVAFKSCFEQFLSHWELTSVETIQAGMMTELRLDVSLKEESKPGAFVAAVQQLNGNNRVMLTTAISSNMGE